LGDVANADKSNANGVYYLLRHGTIFTKKFAIASSSETFKERGKYNNITDSKNELHGRYRKRKRDPSLGGYCTVPKR
jgi:hypothetical protein